MSYPGITFVFMISVAIGSALYYYFNRDWTQQQNQHSAQGHKNDYYEYPYVNVSRSRSPNKGKKKRKESQYEACTICLQVMTSLSTTILSCGHMYHTSCIKEWFDRDSKNKCPLCRVGKNVSNKM